MINKNDNIIRVGDRVLVIDPRPIKYLDYDKTIDDYIEDAKLYPGVEILIKGMKERHVRRIYKAIAGHLLSIAMRKGINKKSLVLNEPNERLRDKTFTVHEKVIKFTGEYYPASGGYTYTDYGDEYDYEPASLGNSQAHICLKLQFGFSQGKKGKWPYDGGIWLTSKQVRKVKEDEDL